MTIESGRPTAVRDFALGVRGAAFSANDHVVLIIPLQHALPHHVERAGFAIEMQ
jgi:hypothetical protein